MENYSTVNSGVNYLTMRYELLKNGRWVTKMCGRVTQILVMDYSTVGDGLLKCVEGLLKYW